MEVHHHAHTPRKKWTHYIWEFLMLFLAVTLGFFVENQREHYIEKSRAKEYAIQLHAELVADSVDFSSEISFTKVTFKRLDSLAEILQHYPVNNISPQTIYTLSAFAFREDVFEPVTTTMEQLKGSGNLRYFGNKNLLKAFSDYDVGVSIITSFYNRANSIEHEMKNIMSRILNIKLVPPVGYANFDKLQLLPGEYSINLDPSLLKQYANWCTVKQRNVAYRFGMLNGALNGIRKLIHELENTYHLK